MVAGIKKSQAQSLTEQLAALAEATGDEAAGRKLKVDQWIAALAAAQTTARAMPNAKSRTFQVSYRIKQIKGKTKGTPGQRREALVAMLESLKPSEKHASTSTWIVRLHIEQADAVLNLLKGPVASFDYLAIAQIGNNRANFGDANLE